MSFCGWSIRMTQRRQRMKISEYKSYDDLPLFLNSELVTKVLGVSTPMCT